MKRSSVRKDSRGWRAAVVALVGAAAVHAVEPLASDLAN